MKRSLFLTLVAILGFLFGGMLFLAPAKAVEGYELRAFVKPHPEKPGHIKAFPIPDELRAALE